MKKLLIAMTAVAVGTCAWADGVTLLDENFTSAPAGWTVDEESGKVSAVATPWSYSGENGAVGDGELKLVNQKLSLNTGSKKLTGAFVSNTSATNIPNENLFFNASVKFTDPSDTLPELDNTDKFALVVLDNVDSLETEGMHDANTTRATNLWVIAHYEGSDIATSKRAYKLNIGGTTDLDSTWLDGEKKIIIKAYKNVVGNRAGFLVMVGTTVCTVQECYAIDATLNMINFKDVIDGASNYLGYEKQEVSLDERYTKKQLLLSLTNDSSLTSVDFQGQGTIDEVSLAATSTAAFGDDVTVKKLTFTGLKGIIGITSTVLTGEKNVFTIPNDAIQNTKYEFTVTVDTGYVLTGNGVTAGADANTYKYTYTYNGAASDSVTLNAFEPVASFDNTPYDTFDAALADAVKVAGTIKIVGTVSAIEIKPNQTLTIDLNGRTIGDIYNDGNLTITNSAVTIGTVKSTDNKSVSGEGSLTIYGGRFEGAVAGVDKSIYGGEFAATYKPADGALAEGKKFGDLTAGYYPVVDDAGSDYTDSKDLVNVDGATEEQKAAVTEKLGAIDAELAKLDGATTGDAGVKAYIQAAYGEGETVPVTTLLDAKNIDISVKFNLPLMTANTDPTIEVAPATADSGNPAAFEFTIKDGTTALTLTEQAKVLEMVEYVADLAADWAKATTADVDTSVSNGKAKVQLKAKQDATKGFMRLKLR